jgi:hypothetical protein
MQKPFTHWGGRRKIREEGGKAHSQLACCPDPGASRSSDPLTPRLLGAVVCLRHWALVHRLPQMSQHWRIPHHCQPDSRPWACNWMGTKSPCGLPTVKSSAKKSTHACTHSITRGQHGTFTTCCHCLQPTKKEEAWSKSVWTSLPYPEDSSAKSPGRTAKDLSHEKFVLSMHQNIT